MPNYGTTARPRDREIACRWAHNHAYGQVTLNRHDSKKERLTQPRVRRCSDVVVCALVGRCGSHTCRDMRTQRAAGLLRSGESKFDQLRGAVSLCSRPREWCMGYLLGCDCFVLGGRVAVT